MKKEILLAIKELSADLQDTKADLKAEIGSVRSELKSDIEKLDQKIEATKVELKEDISNVENKVDLVDSHLYVQAGDLSRTKAEVKMLQDAKS